MMEENFLSPSLPYLHMSNDRARETWNEEGREECLRRWNYFMLHERVEREVLLMMEEKSIARKRMGRKTIRDGGRQREKREEEVKMRRQRGRWKMMGTRVA